MKFAAVKFVWQISYPPGNGVSQGNYFPVKIHFPGLMPNSNNIDDLVQKQLIIEVKIRYRQTDKFFDTICGCVWIFFFQLNLPTPYSLRSQVDFAIVTMYMKKDNLIKKDMIDFISPFV